MHPSPPIFLFDGGCGFCKKWAAWLQRRLPPEVTFVAYQQVEDLDAYGLTEGDVEAASYWIDREGTPHGGARSFARALRHGAGLSPALGALLDAPLVGAAADRLYPIVARNRHRLPAPEAPESD